MLKFIYYILNQSVNLFILASYVYTTSKKNYLLHGQILPLVLSFLISVGAVKH